MINLLEGEKIIYEARKHWIVLVSHIAFLISLKILPIFVLALIPFLPINFSVEGSGPIFTLFIYLCWLNIIWVCIFYVWTNYKLTLWVVTDKRVIMISQQGFFDREKKEIQFEKIQDITVEEEGVMAHLFHFGNLTITTASETGGFVMNCIAHPDNVRNAISEFIHKEEESTSENKEPQKPSVTTTTNL